MNTHQHPHKPSLQFLLHFYNIKPEVLARESGLRPVIALALYYGYGTTRETAQAALNGINKLKNTHYTLSDVRIDLHSRRELTKDAPDNVVVRARTRA